MRMSIATGVGLALVLGVALVGFGDDGVSTSFVVQPTELPGSVLEAVAATFQERGALSSDILGADANIAVEVETTISMTFVGEGAGYKNSVGYFTYDEVGAIIEQHIVFENFSGTGKGLAGGGDLNPGDTVEIGTFGAGVNVGFFLLANGFNKKNAPMWSTLEEMNSDGKDHDAVLSIPDVGSLIGFEDLTNLGDRDYNDALLLINAITMALEEDVMQQQEPEESAFHTTLAELMTALDISMQEARQILSDHGLLAVRRALDEAKGPDTFWSALLGYTIEGTPAAEGGGGVVQDSAMYMDFQLRNPVTGDAVESEHVTLTIVRQPNNVLDILVVPFDPVRGCYSLDLRGMDLDPGAYDLYLDFGNGTSHQLLSLFVPALG